MATVKFPFHEDLFNMVNIKNFNTVEVNCCNGCKPYLIIKNKNKIVKKMSCDNSQLYRKKKRSLPHSWIEHRAVITPQLDREKSGHCPRVVLNIKPLFNIMIFITICQTICCNKFQSDSPFQPAMLLIAFFLFTSLFLNCFNIFKLFKSTFNKNFRNAFDTMFNDSIQNYRFAMHFCISNINWKVDN